MNIFNIFKSKSKLLQVGETSGDYIGCYLFGIEGLDGDPPSYHSLAITKEALVEECKDFFTNLVRLKEESIRTSLARFRGEQDLKIINNALNNLESFVNIHLETDMKQLFLDIPGIPIFLRVGIRKRARVRGKYIE